MAAKIDYFPLYIASGVSFCNRKHEREWLANNISLRKHSLLLSPRRYGKTSLALQVISEQNYINANFDFLMVSDEKSVEEAIFRGVSEIIQLIIPFHKKAFDKITKFLSKLNPEIVLGKVGMKINFKPDTKPVETIVDVLLGLDKLAASENKLIVLLMDEFQQISTIKNNAQIEASIRHAAERAKATCYIFSGSNRQLLHRMFSDRERPLFKICDELRIERISAEHYHDFINKAAKKQWKITLSKEVIDKILAITQRYPYYVNMLCSKLWANSKPPTQKDVEHCWQVYCEEQRSEIAREILPLSLNQKAVLRQLAVTPTSSPTGHEFQKQVGLSNSSLIQALNVLYKLDLIFQDANGYVRLLNPAMEMLLNQ